MDFARRVAVEVKVRRWVRDGWVGARRGIVRAVEDRTSIEG